MKKVISLLFALVFLYSCSSRHEYKGKANEPKYLHSSIKKITDIIVHDIFSPPVASRIYAYVSVAGYEVARHQDSTLLTLAGQLNGLEPVPEPEPGVEYCYPLAAVQAVLQTGRTLIFSEDDLDKFYSNVMDEYRNSGMPDEVFDRSVAYGKKVADHIIGWSSKDNYKQTRSFPKYSIDNSESTWKPTPPAYMDAVEPHWNKIRPFVIDSASQFRSTPPPKFSTEKGSEFYTYANEVYETVRNLTPEQSEIARFWDCNPFVMNVKGHVMFATKKISPGGHWMNITHVACVTDHADFAHSARAYAMVAISLADAFIDCWDEKYRSLLIRPETYINLYIDEDWVPLLQTPPFPEYNSGHSMISGAAATALTSIFGESFSFTDSTEAEFGIGVRKFNSFYEASDEAARSRLFGGIHYAPANESGRKLGRELGRYVVEKVKTENDRISLNQ